MKFFGFTFTIGDEDEFVLQMWQASNFETISVFLFSAPRLAINIRAW